MAETSAQLTNANYVFMVSALVYDVISGLTAAQMDCWWNAATENQGAYIRAKAKLSLTIATSHRPGPSSWAGEACLREALHSTCEPRGTDT